MMAIIIFLLSASTVTSCRILKKDKQSIAEKKQNEADKKAVAEYEKAAKQHYNHQSKDAKKMMKKTKKRAAKFNAPRRRKGHTKSTCSKI